MTAAITLRPAGPDDLPGLLALYAELNPADPPLDAATAEARFTAILAQPGMMIFVAAKGEAPLASCTLVVVPNLTRAGAPYALIENVVTHSSARRQGLGRAVIRHAIDSAWKAGCYKVMLLTGRGDTGTYDFYTDCGFKQDKTGFQVRRPT
jgi:GNAT superfamily N-acetyltransferase